MIARMLELAPPHLPFRKFAVCSAALTGSPNAWSNAILPGAAVEVADVEPVEVRRRLPALGGAAGLLGQLPRGDHASDRGRSARPAWPRTSPDRGQQRRAHRDRAPPAQPAAPTPALLRAPRPRSSADRAPAGDARHRAAPRAGAARPTGAAAAGWPNSGEPGDGCTAGRNWTVLRWGRACRSTALNWASAPVPAAPLAPPGPLRRPAAPAAAAAGAAAGAAPPATRGAADAAGAAGGAAAARPRSPTRRGSTPACPPRSRAGPRRSPSSASTSSRSRSTERCCRRSCARRRCRPW